MAPSQQAGHAPTLDSLLHSKLHLEATIETATSLLKRRQIRGAEPCALATAHVLAQVVAKSKWTDVDQLLDRVYQTGRKLVAAQPHELVVGNIVRRVLGLIRDEAEEDRNDATATESMASSMQDLRAATVAPLSMTPMTPMTSTPSAMTPPHMAHAAPNLAMLASAASVSALASASAPGPAASSFASAARGQRQPSLIAAGPYQSMLSLLSAAEPSTSFTSSGDVSSAGGSGTSTPVHGGGAGAFSLSLSLAGGGGGGGGSGGIGSHGNHMALRDEILDGIEEIKDEVGQADDQIAGFAETQIRPGDHVLVYEPSRTVEKFLSKAAVRRRFTLLLVSCATTATGAGPAPGTSDTRHASLLKRLAANKCPVLHIAGSAAAAYMPRVSRVVLDARAVAANGGVLANAGAARIARAAHAHGRPVLVLGGVFKLSPEPFVDPEAFVEWGDPGRMVRFADGGMVDGIEVEMAVTEYVPPHLVDIYVTNLGPHSRDYLESIVADHYKTDDLELYRQ